MILIRYKLENTITKEVEYKIYSLESIEREGLSALFDVAMYNILSRDEYTYFNTHNLEKIFNGDHISQYNHDSDTYSEGLVTWSNFEAAWVIVSKDGYETRLYKYHNKYLIKDV